MEGVGARLGRSSTRYGPATVFTGPVRKWKKKWVHVSPSASASSNSNNSHSHPQNGTSNGNNGSHLVLYKWTSIAQSQNQNNNNNNNNGGANTNINNGDSGSGKDETAVGTVSEEPPRRKFKYVPVALLEEQKNEAAENEEKVEDEAKPIDVDSSAAEPTRKSDALDDKPDINDVLAEESQGKNQGVRQDLNESTLDLSLGLTSHDDEHDSDPKPSHRRDGRQRDKLW